MKPVFARYVLTCSHFDAMCRASEGRFSRFASRFAFWPLVATNLFFSVVLAVDQLEANEPLGGIVWFGLSVAIMLPLGRFIVAPLMRGWQFRSTRLGGRNYEVSLMDEAIEIKAGDISSRIGLGEILNASETSTYFFLWFNKRQAVILPKNAVVPPHEEDNVRNYILANSWGVR